MYLTSLEINGFKSFDRKALLKFTSPISAIVGPNGSGKSNAAEAFRFVLGEQSLKSMRGKRGEDLIFNGGTGTTRCNRASVKVTFNNVSRMLNIDFDEVTIERVVNRDSSHEYYINGSQVRLKDIVELLAGAHIGASGHHIISQGEADRILTASIRDRREMIEDALGLKLYQYKKQESLKKLEKTDANIKEVESLRREIAPHINFLRKQVEKIQKTEEMRAKLRLLYKEYLYREEIYIAEEKARLKNERKAPEEELARLDQDRRKAEETLSKTKGENVMGDEIMRVQQELDKVRQEKDLASREIGRTEGELQSLKRLIQKERDRAARDENKTIYFKDVEVFAGHIDQEISRLQMDSANVVDILGKIRNYITEFLTTHRGTTDTSLIADSEKDIAELESQKVATFEKIKLISDRENGLVAKFNELRAQVEAEKDSSREAEKMVFKIAARQNELRGTVQTIKAKEDSLNLEEETMKRELAEAYVLVGRDATDTKNFVLNDAEGKPIQREAVIQLIRQEGRSTQETRRKEIERIKIRVEDAGGIGNTAEVMKEFTDAQERDAFLLKELTDLTTTRESLLKLIEELDARLNEEFKEGIVKINSAFQNFFELMFGGGTARLDVIKEQKRKRKKSSEDMMDDIVAGGDEAMSQSEDEDEDAEEGIEINVSLPRKKVKGLMMLSGGERALTSIALLFAISQVKPPPFIILDETDAALDEANSKKYGDMIENLSKFSQLILITHNRETMSRAGVLYGVTMGSDGASRLLSIAFEDALKVAK